MPRATLPRCGECERAIRGRQVISCIICSKKYHKKCFACNTTQQNENFHQLYRLRICSNCNNSLRKQPNSAQSLNSRFQTESETDPLENEDINDFFCFENSQDHYFDVNDMEHFFDECNQNIVFTKDNLDDENNHIFKNTYNFLMTFMKTIEISNSQT